MHWPEGGMPSAAKASGEGHFMDFAQLYCFWLTSQRTGLLLVVVVVVVLLLLLFLLVLAVVVVVVVVVVVDDQEEDDVDNDDNNDDRKCCNASLRWWDPWCQQLVLCVLLCYSRCFLHGAMASSLRLSISCVWGHVRCIVRLVLPEWLLLKSWDRLGAIAGNNHGRTRDNLKIPRLWSSFSMPSRVGQSPTRSPWPFNCFLDGSQTTSVIFSQLKCQVSMWLQWIETSFPHFAVCYSCHFWSGTTGGICGETWRRPLWKSCLGIAGQDQNFAA